MRIHRISMCAVGIIAFVNLFACSTTTNKVTPLAEMPDKSNPGAIYILPKTVVALKIPIKITTYGKFQTGLELQFMKEAATAAAEIDEASRQVERAKKVESAAKQSHNIAKQNLDRLNKEVNSSPDNNALSAETKREAETNTAYNTAVTNATEAQNRYEALLKKHNEVLTKSRQYKASLNKNSNKFGENLAKTLREDINSLQIQPDGIQITEEPIPDTDHIYNIDLSTTFLKDTKKKLVFNESGMLVSADYSAKDKTLEFSVQIVESIAKIASILIPGGGSNGISLFSTLLGQASPQEKSEIKKYNELISLKDSWLFGNNSAGIDPSLDVFKARLAAIDARIEEAKDNILGKEVTTLTLICPIDDSLLLHDGQHKLLPLFTDAIAQQRLAQLQATVREKAGAAGIAKLESLEVIVKINDKHPSQMIKGLVAEPKGERGLYYRMPGEVSITLVQTKDGKLDKVISDTFKVPVAQLGPVLSLPSKMKTTDAAFSMEFFTDTGGLKSLGVETKAIDMQQVEKLGNSGVALVSAIAASNNKINQLKQQKEELSLEMDIRELREGKRPTQ